MDTQTFLNNFETIADAPGGIDLLRELVLDLAVRGLLVPHHDSETAQALLFEISETQKPYEGMTPARFEIPRHWQWAPIGSLTQHQLGKMLNSSRTEGITTKYLRTANVGPNGKFDLAEVKVMVIPEAEIEKYSVLPGDLFVNEGGDVGKSAIWKSELGEGFAFQNHLHRLRPLGGISIEYIQLVLRQAKESGAILALSAGVTIKNFSARTLRSLSCPLPPLEEQCRIVSKVDELLALCDQLETAKTKKDALRTTAREAAIDALSTVTTPDELTQSWERISNNWTTFCNYVEDVDALRQIILRLATRTGLGRTPKSYPVSKLQDISIVSWGNVSLTKSSYVDKGRYCAVSAAGPDGRINHAEHKAYTPVISAIGARCGRLFMPDGDFTAIKNTMTVTPDATRVDNWFLYYALRSSTLPRRGSAQPFLSLSDIKNFEIPIPHDLDEQAEIVRQVDELMLLCDKVEVALSQRDALQGRLTSSVINETEHTA